MSLTVTIAVSLLLSHCLWNVMSKDASSPPKVTERKITSTLQVDNGGPWGEWGKLEFCPKGYAQGFSLKVDKTSKFDKTGANGIRLYCTDGSVITSSIGRYGDWSDKLSCSLGYLTSFALRVLPPRGMLRDDTAVNNIKFTCPKGDILEGNGLKGGTYGNWSKTCNPGEICGLQTKVEIPKGVHLLDHTTLNDVKLLCCS